MSRHRVQVHSCTKSNRPANSFILSSVAARGRSFRVFECRHFQMGIRRSVGNDSRVQLEDFDSTDNKAWIILPILDVFVRCPNRYIYTYIFFYFYIYIHIYLFLCMSLSNHKSDPLVPHGCWSRAKCKIDRQHAKHVAVAFRCCTTGARTCNGLDLRKFLEEIYGANV